MLANKKCKNEFHDTEFKRTITNFIKELKELEDRKKQLSEIENELKKNKCLSDVQENTNIKTYDRIQTYTKIFHILCLFGLKDKLEDLY